MYRSRRLFEMTFLDYVLWCIGEIVLIGAFYTNLTVEITGGMGETGLEIFGRSILYGTIALGVPYIISGMYLSIIDKNTTIRLMSYENVVTDEAPVHENPLQKITLFDNSGSLKMSLNLDSLYYIESDDNYIKVWYTESFKGCLVRCNRKYIVNMDKVKVLRKESDAYVLELDNEAIPTLPITKTYTDIVLAHFTEKQPLLDPID